MGLGVLDTKDRSRHVPRTSVLDNHAPGNGNSSRNLKKSGGTDSHIILVPQPSDDDNDPLNWPLWQRDSIFLLNCAGVLLTIGGFSAVLSPIAFTLVQEFNTSFTDVSLLTGYCLAATGAIGVFVSAICRRYGKRPVLLLSMMIALAGSLWAAESRSYNSMLGARVLQGTSMAYFESVSYSVAGDLFYVHERGLRIAVLTCMVSGISNLPVLVSGKVAESLGWRWIFWLLAIFSGILLLTVFFFGWETAFKRPNDGQVNDQRPGSTEGMKEMDMEITRVEDSATRQNPRSSFLRRLAPFSGVYADQSLLKLVVRPFTVAVNPAVVWACLTLCFPVLWIVGISLVMAQLLSAPPYLLNPTQIGYVNAGAVVAGLVANIICGAISDWSATWMSRKNGGLYEPEFRLLLLNGLLICATLGYFLFGNLIDQGISVVSIAAIYGVIVASVQFASVTVGTYMNDAYRQISVEVFILTMIFKNFLFFGFSFFVNDWVGSWGPAKTFNAIGGIQIGLCSLTIPLYLYGKRLRLWWYTTAWTSRI